MSQSDEQSFSHEEVEDNSVEEVESGISLADKEEKDEALWNSEHTSDDEEYDPENPEDLSTKTAKADAEEDPSGDEDEDEDDSIVNDEIEYTCADHAHCVSLAEKVDAFLLESCSALCGRKERQVAIAEMICDNFTKLQQ